jgi:8-oxo-dGTP pyrophosphatase MutT (NUDIX family)
VPLVVHAAGPTVLLTLRSDHLRDHAGQVSFPGGRAEPVDRDAVDTALREAEEEVGLPRAQVEVIGSLPSYTTVTNFVVTPVVGLIEPGYTVAPDPFEVAEVFEVPLDFLMAPAHHRRHAFDWPGGRREFLSMPWRPAPGADEIFIWGATAAMLRNFYGFLAA